MRQYILENRFFIAAILVLAVVIGLNTYSKYEYNEAKNKCTSENHMFVEGVCYKFQLSK